MEKSQKGSGLSATAPLRMSVHHHVSVLYQHMDVRSRLRRSPHRMRTPLKVTGQLPGIRGTMQYLSPGREKRELAKISPFRLHPSVPATPILSPRRQNKHSSERPSLASDTSHRVPTASTGTDSLHLRSVDRSRDTQKIDEESVSDLRNVIQTPSSIRETADEMEERMLDKDLIVYYENQLTPGLMTVDTPEIGQSKTPDLKTQTMMNFCWRSVLRRSALRDSHTIERPEQSSTPPLGIRHKSMPDSPISTPHNLPRIDHKDLTSRLRPKKPVSTKPIFIPTIRTRHRSQFSRQARRRV